MPIIPIIPIIQSFKHSIIQPFNQSIIPIIQTFQSLNHWIIESFNHAWHTRWCHVMLPIIMVHSLVPCHSIRQCRSNSIKQCRSQCRTLSINQVWVGGTETQCAKNKFSIRWVAGLFMFYYVTSHLRPAIRNKTFFFLNSHLFFGSGCEKPFYQPAGYKSTKTGCTYPFWATRMCGWSCKGWTSKRTRW